MSGGKEGDRRSGTYYNKGSCGKVILQLLFFYKEIDNKLNFSIKGYWIAEIIHTWITLVSSKIRSKYCTGESVVSDQSHRKGTTS